MAVSFMRMISMPNARAARCAGGGGDENGWQEVGCADMSHCGKVRWMLSFTAGDGQPRRNVGSEPDERRLRIRCNTTVAYKELQRDDDDDRDKEVDDHSDK